MVTTIRRNSIRASASADQQACMIHVLIAIVLAVSLAPASRAADEAEQGAAAAPHCATLTLLGEAACRTRDKGRCELGDRVSVEADPACLAGWIAAGHDPSKLVPIINGRMLTGVDVDPPSGQGATFHFDLKRQSPANGGRELWAALVGDARSNPTLAVALGVDGESESSNTVPLKVDVLPSSLLLVCAVGFLVLLTTFVLLARRSDVIRDPGPAPAENERLPYSLARTQMAVWFFVVLAAYLYLWLLTGDYDTLTTEVLTLIGISAATGVTAMVVDAGKRDERIQKRQALERQKEGLAVQVASLQAAVIAATATAEQQADLNARKAELAEVALQLKNLPDPPSPKSDSFLLDILRDEHGVSFYRFQMAAWTVVLGTVFLVALYKSLAMPAFGTTLLGLMGISSGTYLGFKIPQAPQ